MEKDMLQPDGRVIFPIRLPSSDIEKVKKRSLRSFLRKKIGEWRTTSKVAGLRLFPQHAKLRIFK